MTKTSDDFAVPVKSAFFSRVIHMVVFFAPHERIEYGSVRNRFSVRIYMYGPGSGDRSFIGGIFNFHIQHLLIIVNAVKNIACISAVL